MRLDEVFLVPLNLGHLWEALMGALKCFSSPGHLVIALGPERRTPSVAVDVVLVRPDGSIVLVKRAKEPFKGYWALPGGFVRYGERVEDAARREAREETGLEVAIEGLVGVYSEPDRDPRGHVISIAFLAREVGGLLRAASDAAEVRAFKILPERLAFDHARIIGDAVRKFGLKISSPEV